MNARPTSIVTIPAHYRTAAQRGAPRGTPGYRPELDQPMSVIVQSAPSVVQLLMNGIFGTVADRQAGAIVEDFAHDIQDAINNQLFEGVLFEVAVYKSRSTNEYGTHEIRMIRPGANVQDALERDLYFLNQENQISARPNPSLFTYDNNQSYFIFVRKDNESESFVAEKTTNPQMLRRAAAAKMISGDALEARRLLESDQLIQTYRQKIERVRRRDANDLVRIQVENLAAARIKLEQDLRDARALLEEAQKERNRAAALSRISNAITLLGGTLKLGADLAPAFGATNGGTLGGSVEDHLPGLKLEYEFDPTLDFMPSLEDHIRGLEQEAARIDNILS